MMKTLWVGLASGFPLLCAAPVFAAERACESLSGIHYCWLQVDKPVICN